MRVARVRTSLVTATASRHDPDRDEPESNERNRCSHAAHAASITPIDTQCNGSARDLIDAARLNSKRYMDEANPSLTDVAQVAALLAERGMLMRGL